MKKIKSFVEMKGLVIRLFNLSVLFSAFVVAVNNNVLLAADNVSASNVAEIVDEKAPQKLDSKSDSKSDPKSELVKEESSNQNVSSNESSEVELNTEYNVESKSKVESNVVANADSNLAQDQTTSNASLTTSSTDSSIASSTPLTTPSTDKPYVGLQTNNDMIWFLVCSFGVIGSIFILSWLLKKLRLVPNMGIGNKFKIMAVLPVGPKEKVLLLNVGNEQIVIGVTPQNISMLHKLSEPIDFTQSDKSKSFKTEFSKLLQKNSNESSSTLNK